jgi:transcriptional regulator with XRE-family HTH domain
MAAKLNIKRESYAHFEQGKNKNITINYLYQLAEIFNIDISELLPIVVFTEYDAEKPLLAISQGEKELLTLFRQLPIDYKNKILEFIRKSKAEYIDSILTL